MFKIFHLLEGRRGWVRQKPLILSPDSQQPFSLNKLEKKKKRWLNLQQINAESDYFQNEWKKEILIKANVTI